MEIEITTNLNPHTNVIRKLGEVINSNLAKTRKDFKENVLYFLYEYIGNNNELKMEYIKSEGNVTKHIYNDMIWILSDVPISTITNPLH